MAKYRKKPVVIEAEQFIAPPSGQEYPFIDHLGVYYDATSSTKYSIDTLEGKHEVTNGDWIITGVKGEKYPCKPDIFALTYESVKDYPYQYVPKNWKPQDWNDVFIKVLEIIDKRNQSKMKSPSQA